jgi:hypothetical protein
MDGFKGDRQEKELKPAYAKQVTPRVQQPASFDSDENPEEEMRKTHVQEDHHQIEKQSKRMHPQKERDQAVEGVSTAKA